MTVENESGPEVTGEPIQSLIDIAGANAITNAVPSRVSHADIGDYPLKVKVFKTVDELNVWLQDEGALFLLVDRQVFESGSAMNGDPLFVVWYYEVEMVDSEE